MTCISASISRKPFLAIAVLPDQPRLAARCLAKQSLTGYWIDAVRPSRRAPADTVALLRMRDVGDAILQSPHPEERA
jgi:hypothetical protein